MENKKIFIAMNNGTVIEANFKSEASCSDKVAFQKLMKGKEFFKVENEKMEELYIQKSSISYYFDGYKE